MAVFHQALILVEAAIFGRIKIEKIDTQHLFLWLCEFAQQEIGTAIINADFRHAAAEAISCLRLQQRLEHKRIGRVDITFDAAQLLEYKPAVFDIHR